MQYPLRPLQSIGSLHADVSAAALRPSIRDLFSWNGLKEKIGKPDLLVGRVQEFAKFHKWISRIPDLLSKSRVILARRKSVKTSFVQRIFNQLWSANGKVILFYCVFEEKMNRRQGAA